MNSWRRVQDFPCPGGYVIGQEPGLLACGASHWLVHLYKSYADDREKVIAFDFGKEEYQMLSLPSFTEVFDHNCLAVLQGCLCVYSVKATIQVTLYVMKPYGVKNEDWTKVLTVTQDAIPRDFFEYIRPLMYSKSGDKLLFEETFQRLLWYDLEEKKNFEIEIGNKPPAFLVEVCLESLVVLGEDNSFDGRDESNSDDGSHGIEDKILVDERDMTMGDEALALMLLAATAVGKGQEAAETQGGRRAGIDDLDQ
ncbi:hypothetical protein HS088_TW21G01015 [Tripterygium wilfordii]|uniref:F-box associated beta-propeller type 1 domain-containing protein n=1 Tax=Tripterygium wilfordii TaxID=458696 RepID=A0A7J7C410_TRIWF|nr:F-box protein CPR1-like [Tripterygium wilfordii]XP_038689096.1 F-box protein CPR1-like [Tripterygium wilfordii]KAF5728861.1 hypothetical protein HS088_TW21G01015 [Tripterygium wilfordii]